MATEQDGRHAPPEEQRPDPGGENRSPGFTDDPRGRGEDDADGFEGNEEDVDEVDEDDGSF